MPPVKIIFTEEQKTAIRAKIKKLLDAELGDLDRAALDTITRDRCNLVLTYLMVECLKEFAFDPRDFIKCVEQVAEKTGHPLRVNATILELSKQDPQNN